MQRLEAIRQELLSADEVSIDALASRFGVSGMTIRRDLELLESRGDAVRTYGGAALARRLTLEFSFRERQNRNSEQKRRIAVRAAEHIRDNQVILLDKGEYVVHFVTDGSHAYGDWDDDPPDDPEAWGITVTLAAKLRD